MTNASVKRRNGTVVPFDGNKIKIAVGKALAATQHVLYWQSPKRN